LRSAWSIFTKNCSYYLSALNAAALASVQSGETPRVTGSARDVQSRKEGIMKHIDGRHLDDLVAANTEFLCRHFFPHGHKIGPEWHIANISGSRGNSLGVQLTGSRAGLWIDRDGSGGGTFVELIMQHLGLTFPDAARAIGNALGVNLESTDRDELDNSRSCGKPFERSYRPEARQLHPVLEEPSFFDLETIWRTRKISLEGLRLAVERGFVFVASIKDERAWVITDSSRRCYIARRLDAEPWLLYGKPKKSYTLSGSEAARPIGLEESRPYPQIALVEGAPDLLACFGHLYASGAEERVAPVCMASASINLAEAHLAYFQNKAVTIFGHDDEEGERAVKRWARPLRCVASSVLVFSFVGLTKSDGQPVRDFNDLCEIDADSWEQHQAAIESMFGFSGSEEQEGRDSETKTTGAL
jgi:hypothetical protein